MNEPKPTQLARMAYIVAVLFAVHLVTYFIPGIRDATPTNHWCWFTKRTRQFSSGKDRRQGTPDERA